MNWKRYKTLIITSSVFLILAIAGLVFYVMGRGQLADLERDISRKDKSIKQLGSSKPVPSQESYMQLQQTLAELVNRADTFSQIITNGQAVIRQQDPAGFGDYASGKIAALLRKATAATDGGEDGVVVRDKTFGLETYLEGVPPQTADVDRLMLQLEYMVQISEVLFGEGISELLSVERTRFEGQQTVSVAPTGLPTALGAGNNRRNNVPQEPTEQEKLDAKRKELFVFEKFTVRFRAYERSVIGVLNAIASHPLQMVVTKMELSNGNRRLWPDYQRPSDKVPELTVFTPAQTVQTTPRGGGERLEIFDFFDGGNTATTAEEPAEPVATQKVGLAEQREKTTGGELLEVVLEINMYRLKDEQPATDAEVN